MNHDNRGRLSVDLDGKWRLYTETVPPGATPLGTITRSGYDTGALVQFERTGLYAQVNAGAIRSLDGRKISAALDAAHRESA
jgi:hypothetical protein